jgi:hypothetical protein
VGGAGGGISAVTCANSRNRCKILVEGPDGTQRVMILPAWAVAKAEPCDELNVPSRAAGSSSGLIVSGLPEIDRVNEEDIGGRVSNGMELRNKRGRRSPAIITFNAGTTSKTDKKSRVPAQVGNDRRVDLVTTAKRVFEFDGGCDNWAQTRGLFKSHGGGKRCMRSGCNKSAQSPTLFCVVHGGGKRCQHLGCDKSAEGANSFCIAHGGGKRCHQSGWRYILSFHR